MRTALLTFDSQQLNLILTKMLNDLGLSVVTALSCDDAASICQDKHPDVVFTDWSFHGKSAQELFHVVQDPTCIVFISQNNNPADIERALKMGAKEYIIKPFDSDILQSKLSMLELI